MLEERRWGGRDEKSLFPAAEGISSMVQGREGDVLG